MADDTRRPPGETLWRSETRRLHALPVTRPTHLSTLPDGATVQAPSISKPEAMACRACDAAGGHGRKLRPYDAHADRALDAAGATPGHRPRMNRREPRAHDTRSPVR